MGPVSRWPIAWPSESAIQVGETVVFFPSGPLPDDPSGSNLSAMDNVPHPGDGCHWVPGEYQNSCILRAGKPQDNKLWFKWNDDMQLMEGNEPADPEGSLARALSNRPTTTEAFPGELPRVARRHDATLNRLVSLSECLEWHSDDIDFDPSELV